MSRKNHVEVRAPEGWPVEWTFAGFVVVIFGAITQIGRMWQMFSVGHCTSLGGLCTPIECTCPESLRKRELVTQDGQTCYQCVADFCPVVAEGDSDCSREECECEDPTWPRVDLQVDGRSCWQCVRPPLDFTAQADSQNHSCFARAQIQDGGSSSSSSSSSIRLVGGPNQSECVAFRYRGLRITEKRQNESCLAWQSFGQFWELAPCNDQDVSMQFRQIVADDAAPVQSTFCSGSNAEFCIDVAENLCTEEEGRCSNELCRCEDPTWTRQDFQTLNGSQCFLCSPSPMMCPTEEGKCVQSLCECSGAMYTKVRDNSGSEDKPCFRCQLNQRGAFGGSEASTLGLVIIFVLLGLAVGCCVRRCRETGETKGKARRLALPAGATWSERLAAELEDVLESLYLFAERVLSLRWAQPQIKQLGKWSSWAMDEFDLAFQPVIDVTDGVQEAIWDWVVVQHERLVAAAFWSSTVLSDLIDKLSSMWAHQPSEDDFVEDEAICSATKGGGRAKKNGTRGKELAKSSVPTSTDTKKGSYDETKSAGRPEREATSKPSQPCPAHADQSEPDLPMQEAGAGTVGNVQDGATQCAAQGVEVPEALLRRLFAAPGQQGVRSAPSTNGHSQSRAQRKLQQRRAEQAQRGAAQACEPPAENPLIDDSWIDELEACEPKARSSKKDFKASKASKKKGSPAIDETFDSTRILSEAMHGLFLLSASEAEVASSNAVEPGGGQEPEEVPEKTQTERGDVSAEEHAFPSNEPGAVAKEEEKEKAGDSLFENGFETGRRSKKNASKRLQQQLQKGQKAQVQQSQEGLRETAARALAPPAPPAQQSLQETPLQAAKPQRNAGPVKRERCNTDKAQSKKKHLQKSEKSEEQAGEAGEVEPRARPISFVAAVTSSLENKAPVPETGSSSTSLKQLSRASSSSDSNHSIAPSVQQDPQPHQAAQTQVKQLQTDEKEPGEPKEPFSELPASKPAADRKTAAPGKRDQRAWTEVVAPWAKSNMSGAEGAKHSSKVKSKLDAAAPEFVPQGVETSGPDFSKDHAAIAPTSVMIFGLPAGTAVKSLMHQLDDWGLGGTYDFLHVMLESGAGTDAAVINFVDPAFVTLFCYMCQDYSFQASISMADVQGLEALIAHWSNQDDGGKPTIIPNAMPTQWAVNAVNNMLSPHQIKDQFRKTKMCVYNKKNWCEMGPACPYAHSKEELQPMPDLVKTKMCFNFFQRKCSDVNCKFAHGSAELRSVWMPYCPGIWLPVEEVSEWNPLGEAALLDFDSNAANQQGMGNVDTLEMPYMEAEESTNISWKGRCKDSEKGAMLFEALPQQGVRRKSSLEEGNIGDVALRVRNSFLEVVQEEDDNGDEDFDIHHSMKRSFSDSHIANMNEAISEACEL